MKFTYSMLGHYLKGAFTLDDVVSGLIDIGLEVESVTNEAERLKDFILAEIKDTRRHPEADRLQICTVDTGSQVIELVCGGKNARPGIKVILAPVGAIIPSTGQVLKAGKVRGVDSPGMLCSSDELVIDIPCDGILEVVTDLPLGTNAAIVLGLNDPVIDVSITPNRSDCFSVLGIARDLYAYFSIQNRAVTFKPFEVSPHVGSFDCPIRVTNNAPEACYAFGLTLVKNVRNNPSPPTMSSRLRALGLRPISALVDITNYMCFDAGRPLHVFDADKVKGNIVLRLSTNGEIFEALDDKTYTLDDGMLVMCDDAGIISLAGVMGGKRTGCDEATKNVLIESAWFDPVTIARTGQKLNIISDARMRFERGVDPDMVIPGMDKAIALVQELCGGDASKTTWIKSREPNNATITLTLAKLERVSGENFRMDSVRKSLELLGFSMISATTDSITVTVPSHRHDIFEDIDLVEEVLRLRGTDAIVEVPLPIKPVPATLPTARHILSTTLVNLGYVETINFSFLDHETAVLFGDEKHLIHLKNPITADLTTMRTSLMPSLLKVASDNQKRAMETIPLFEVANVYGNHVKDHQTLHCAALWAGKNHPHHWHHKKDDVTFFDIKDHMMTVLEAFGIKESNLQLTTDSLASYYHPTRAAVIKQGNRILGSIGQLHPKVLKHMDVHGAVCGFDINVSLLPPQKQKRTGVKDLSPYQPVEKDFAFLVNKDFEAGKLPQILMQKLTRQSTFPKYVTLERADIFDIFPMEDQKSIALALRFQPEQATLSETDLDHIMTTVINLIQKETGGTLRQ